MKTREQKRAEAAERQSEREAIAFDRLAVLAKIALRPGESKRERARILAEVTA